MHIRENLEKFREEEEDDQLDEVTMETTFDEKPPEHSEINDNEEPDQLTALKVDDIINKIKFEVKYIKPCLAVYISFCLFMSVYLCHVRLFARSSFVRLFVNSFAR